MDPLADLQPPSSNEGGRSLGSTDAPGQYHEGEETAAAIGGGNVANQENIGSIGPQTTAARTDVTLHLAPREYLATLDETGKKDLLRLSLSTLDATAGRSLTKEIWGEESPHNVEVREEKESGGESCHQPRSGSHGCSFERCASVHVSVARSSPSRGRSRERCDRRTRERLGVRGHSPFVRRSRSRGGTGRRSLGREINPRAEEGRSQNRWRYSRRCSVADRNSLEKEGYWTTARHTCTRGSSKRSWSPPHRGESRGRVKRNGGGSSWSSPSSSPSTESDERSASHRRRVSRVRRDPDKEYGRQNPKDRERRKSRRYWSAKYMGPLPTPALPRFDDKTKDSYVRFIKHFRAVVAHTDYTDEDRLRFLAEVCDEPVSKQYLQMIQAYGAEGGYQEALEYLSDNFGLKVGKTQRLLEKLRERSKMEEGDLTGVRQVYADLREYSLHLHAQGGSSSGAAELLRRDVIGCLPQSHETRYYVEERRRSYKMMLEHLINYVAETMMIMRSVRPREREPEESITNKPKAEYTKPKSGAEVREECCLCLSNHPLRDCRAFKRMDPSSRMSVVIRHRACYRCLGKGHNSSTSTSTSVCGEIGCGGKHSVLLRGAMTPLGATRPARGRGSAEHPSSSSARRMPYQGFEDQKERWRRDSEVRPARSTRVSPDEVERTMTPTTAVSNPASVKSNPTKLKEGEKLLE
ncbi:uncharacterized protein LOC126995640 [Eriocheir sinensis]|uniref:uncharacterized protein LOC126995640 n=1 Tax=Eriocheir sinensis TaxID=95602 RepID=UPI0021C68764|nr:uncharacterized protein LOC126995640 [Eriocheir sinensis]